MLPVTVASSTHSELQIMVPQLVAGCPFVSLLVSSLHPIKNKGLGSGAGFVLCSVTPRADINLQSSGALLPHQCYQKPVLAELGGHCREFCTASLSFSHLGACPFGIHCHPVTSLPWRSSTAGVVTNAAIHAFCLA